MKKVLIINTSDLVGGAARAANRIHKGLLSKNIHSRMLVQNQLATDETVIGPDGFFERQAVRLNPKLDDLVCRLNGGTNSAIFSVARKSLYPVMRKVKAYKPDLVNLHWVSGGMMQCNWIGQFDCPVVWTLHDMWPFTGGCHYDNECGRYTDECGNCPQLKKNGPRDLSYEVLKKKSRVFRSSDFSVVTPSRWLAKCARESKVMADKEIKVIPNGIDLSVFKPLDRKFARSIWNLPAQKKLVLFGAMCSTSDKRKGFDLLLPAIKRLMEARKYDVQLVIFGDDGSEFGPDVRAIGTLSDEISLSTLYAAADVMVVPSRQDNLPNTVVESLACGTPVVGFNIGGMSDMVSHKEHGYLVRPFDEIDLADGINWVLSDEERHLELSRKARAKAESHYDVNLAAENYWQFFQQAMEKHS